MSIYYGTKRVSTVSLSRKRPTMILYIEKDWGFVQGDMVNFTIRLIDEPEEMALRVIKKVQAAGNSFRVSIDRDWGFEPGDWVVYTVERVEEFDTRIRS